MIVTVHTSRIKENFDTVRLAYGKPLIFMCKANAYGHGMVEAASVIKPSAFGVATEEEGARLRPFVSAPILVTSPRISAIEAIAVNGLIPFVGEENYARALIDSHSVKRCHIKVDSGMHRSGFSSPKVCSEIVSRLVANGITVEGICTHYIGTDKENVLRQNAFFDECVRAIRGALFPQDFIPYTHVTFSGAPYAARYDRLRVGLAAYGYEIGRHPVHLFGKAMEVTSEVLNVKRLKVGDSLGYDRVFIADRPLSACTVLGGYADGIDRRDVGQNVIVNGKRARIAAVCMDTFEVVSDAVDLCVEDRVIILSDETDARYIAERRGTIPYEVLVGFDTRRAERKYER